MTVRSVTFSNPCIFLLNLFSLSILLPFSSLMEYIPFFLLLLLLLYSLPSMFFHSFPLFLFSFPFPSPLSNSQHLLSPTQLVRHRLDLSRRIRWAGRSCQPRWISPPSPYHRSHSALSRRSRQFRSMASPDSSTRTPGSAHAGGGGRRHFRLAGISRRPCSLPRFGRYLPYLLAGHPLRYGCDLFLWRIACPGRYEGGNLDLVHSLQTQLASRGVSEEYARSRGVPQRLLDRINSARKYAANGKFITTTAAEGKGGKKRRKAGKRRETVERGYAFPSDHVVSETGKWNHEFGWFCMVYSMVSGVLMMEWFAFFSNSHPSSAGFLFVIGAGLFNYVGTVFKCKQVNHAKLQ